MNENDADVVHAGIVSKSQNIPEFGPLLPTSVVKPKMRTNGVTDS
jgi:hypothetical protein